MLKEFIVSLKRPGNESLIETIQQGYKACFEDIHDYYERREEAMYNVIHGCMNSKEGEIQPWQPIPLAHIKPLWEDFMKYGFVRNGKAVERLADNIIKKITIIHANTYLAGHTSQDPRGDIEELEEMDEKTYDNFQDKLANYIYDGHGQYRISDYAMDDLETLATQMTDATGEELILLIDRVLNITHQRSDLAAMFVEGGRNALDELAGNNKAVTESIQQGYNAIFESPVAEVVIDNKHKFIDFHVEDYYQTYGSEKTLEYVQNLIHKLINNETIEINEKFLRAEEIPTLETPRDNKFTPEDFNSIINFLRKVEYALKMGHLTPA
jgi:hypothetical protein